MCEHFHLHASVGCSVNIYANEVLFCFEFEHLGAHPCWLRRAEKRLARDVFDTFVTRVYLAGDVTDTERWTQMLLSNVGF